MKIMLDTWIEILEHEAKELYYIDNSEKPFLYFHDGIGISPPFTCQVYFDNITFWNFKTTKEAREKIKQIVDVVKSKGKTIFMKKRFRKKIVVE